MMRGPNMSYCAAENTALAMEQLIDLVKEGGEEYIRDLSRYERTGHIDLINLCQAYLELMEQHEQIISIYDRQ